MLMHFPRQSGMAEGDMEQLMSWLFVLIWKNGLFKQQQQMLTSGIITILPHCTLATAAGTHLASVYCDIWPQVMIDRCCLLVGKALNFNLKRH